MGLIIGGVLLIAFALWTVIAPRQQWLMLNAWRYRDPDANEPSDLAYNLGRAAGVGTILLVVILGGYLIRADAVQGDADDIRQAREQRFGTRHVELTLLPPAVVAGSSGATGPSAEPTTATGETDQAGSAVAVWRYATVQKDNPFDLDLPTGTNLIVAVDGAFRVDALDVQESPDAVTVELTGACTQVKLLCEADRTSPVPPVRLYPVTLAAPLNGRPLIDRSTGEEAVGR
ncbi:hypothetical protein M1L60_35060 [Actinoplanes sp. TRM 88003]|uniref:DUF6199 domain-containing protein n=1 Tax=Paractinoplanes aksuensis TaxID=2939490 RepID=A0ABT1DYC8_9ACTN|nr:DUF6199 family natural product biosynthesis protein [Actinoplanes aksuensis]MCO8275813.1 hypothetical protein [Actinoplanes aksuensis]